MADLQKIIKVTQEQYNILKSGGTVGEYTGINPNYLYLVKDNNVWATEQYVDDAIDGLAPVARSGNYNDLYNKPTIPTVNNGIFTIQANGTSATFFTANQSENKTLNIKGSGGTTVTKSGSDEITISTGIIPTVNNAILTITQNNTSIGTFTANASSNVSVNIETPQVKRYI